MIYEDEHCTVVCQPLNHGISSFGFAIVEKSQSGKFMPDRAKERGIEPGPSYAILKAGGRVTLPDGTVVNGDELVGARKRGRKVVICGDTGVSADLPTLAAGADILVHEATFMQDRLERAIEVGHSTAVQAAKAALFAGVQQLILTHFSPRYDNEHSGILADLLKEAQEIFPNTILAEDFLEIDVSLSS
jgi:ribonuclease Z